MPTAGKPTNPAVRVRFAPSPTGYLHIGGVRTALYNWLWARQQGGTFVLRIEDTDRERSTEPAVRAILDSMRWLGLDWDEGPEVGGPHGPYFQMERLELYQLYAQKLIEAGGAYRCYCSAEDLQLARAQHKTRTGSEQGFRYPGTCRERTDTPAKPFVVRLRVPDSGVIAWDDLIKGRLEFPVESQQDAVLMRNNGVPLYNLGAVVDDITMAITLVARADDHVINTPQQILMYQALAATLPQFAHMPLILSPGGAKLSKRDAAVGLMEYREQGYVPDGLLNYLVRLGWSHGDQELFTRAELIEKFDWEHVGSKGGRWDQKKLISVQASHLRMLSPEQAAEQALPFVRARGLTVAEHDPRLSAAAALVLPRASTLVELAEAVDYFFRDPPVVDDAAARKLLTADSADKLEALATLLATVEAFDRGTLELAVKAWLDQRGHALQDVAQAARVALTGRKASPGLFEVMEVLGRDRSVARLAAGAARARAIA
jgi:glutamyl-tRNA synthetase